MAFFSSLLILLKHLYKTALGHNCRVVKFSEQAMEVDRPLPLKCTPNYYYFMTDSFSA